MSKIQPLTRTPTLALRQRKARLLRPFQLSPDFLHASLIERFMKCGKANCHCHSAGPKHGPFFYLNRGFAKGQIQSLLLKSPNQVDQARHSLALTASPGGGWIKSAKSTTNCSAEANPLLATGQ